MKKRLWGILLSITIIFSFNFTVFASTVDEVKQILKYHYVDDVPQSVLDAETIEDAIKALNDPYTQYFTFEEFKDFINSINNTFSGIGVQIERVDEGIKIMTVFDGSPAKEVGLKSGDIIIEADGTSLAGLQVENAVKLIRGQEGTVVNLKVKRGQDILEFSVTRRKIILPSVELSKMHNFGYIKLSTFGEDTDKDFKSIVEKNMDLDGFIIDLRNNPGGYLNTAINLGGYFVGKRNIVLLKNKDLSEEWPSEEDEILKGKKVIFLVNENSASASEVLTGAIKDYKRGLIVGNKTFGKGTVQTLVALSDGGVLKYTIQKFYSPLDKEINKVGITPDILVKEPDMQLNIAAILLGKSKNSDKRGFAMVKIDNYYYEINKSLLNNKKYYDAFIFLLNNNYIREYYDGTNERYVKVIMNKQIIEKLATNKAYVVKVKTKKGYSNTVRFRAVSAVKKGA
ncbi:MAG: S41 family peptidase [Caloramator sp.]|nr:S41 family peptidase [Caloramator sp.]